MGRGEWMRLERRLGGRGFEDLGQGFFEQVLIFPSSMGSCVMVLSTAREYRAGQGEASRNVYLSRLVTEDSATQPPHGLPRPFFAISVIHGVGHRLRKRWPKTHLGKVIVETEVFVDSFPPHEHKCRAIRKAKVLIRILNKYIKGIRLHRPINFKHSKSSFVDALYKPYCQVMSFYGTVQIGYRFVQNKITDGQPVFALR